MEVSIWWAVAALFVGTSLGFLLFALLEMARDPEEAGRPLESSGDVRTLV